MILRFSNKKTPLAVAMVFFTFCTFFHYVVTYCYSALIGYDFIPNEKLLVREYMLKFAVFYDTVLVIFAVGFYFGKRNRQVDRHVV